MKKSLHFLFILSFWTCILPAQTSYSQTSIYQSGILNRVNQTPIDTVVVAADTLLVPKGRVGFRYQMLTAPIVISQNGNSDKHQFNKSKESSEITKTEAELTEFKEEVKQITEKYERLYCGRDETGANLNYIEEVRTDYQPARYKNPDKNRSKFGDGIAKVLMVPANIIGFFAIGDD